MDLYSLILDSFLDDFEEFRKHAITRSYAGVTNPSDNVFYPDISIDIPINIQDEIMGKLYVAMSPYIEKGQYLHPRVMFMRLSKEGVHVPHQAHTDAVMGQYTFLLYLNAKEDCKGGTTVLKHKDGMDRDPKTPDQAAVWKRDMNIYNQWEIVGNCEMQPNRGFIIRSELFHRAEPPGGFGNSNNNGRLVLTCFFDVAGKHEEEE